MALSKLQFRPGINTEITSYSNEGGWFDCDKIRFRINFPEKIGGWQPFSADTFVGTARSLEPFFSLEGARYTAIGTHLKYYIEEGGVYHDITPIRFTAGAGESTFAATPSSSTLIITDVDSGAALDDFVTFSDAVSLGGNITAEVLNQEYQITQIIDADTYTVTAKDTDGNEVFANASDLGDGGSSTVAEYQINTGLVNAIAGNGWGAGPWSRSTWGSGVSLLITGNILRLWDQDAFGEDLIMNYRDGGIYYWDTSANAIGTEWGRAVALSDLPGADDFTPTIAKQIIVSDVDRHIIAFGCDDEYSRGLQDPLLIRFSDQENPLVWASQATNTAGSLRIGSGSEIICAVETRQQIVVFTDVSLHAMQFLGPPFTFGINLISENVTIASPNAAQAVEDTVYWLGREDFYVYTGQVQKLPCDVRNYVFDNFNTDQTEKVTSGLNSTFNEIWWFYPTGDSDENDSYVVFNYAQNVWYYGSLARTAWVDGGVNGYPIAAASDNRLYYHEIGHEDGETGEPLYSFIESSPIDIGDGEQFMFITRIIPDLTFSGSETPTPKVDFTVKMRNFPGSNYNQIVDSEVDRIATFPLEQFTGQLHVRLRGRSMALQISSDEPGTQWRLGSPRIDMRTDGKR